MNIRFTNKAYSLAEVLAATVLVVIIAIAVFAAFTVGMNYLRNIMELREATLILQEEQSKLRDLKFPEIEALGPTFSSSAMASLNNASGAIIKNYYKPNNKIIKVTLRLDWTTYANNPNHKTITTLITDHGINKK